MAKCKICGSDEAFIAIGKWRQPNTTFSDLISNQVCWDCYVAIVRPVDRKLENARQRIAKAQNLQASYSYYHGQYTKDMRNAAAWEEAIRNKHTQRQLYGLS